MKYISLIGVLLLCAYIPVHAQSCDNFNSNTYISTVNTWDWRNNDPVTWDSYVTIEDEPFYAPLSLNSPLQPVSSPNWPNVNHLFSLTPGETFDYEPEDGWELVYRNFGGPSQQEAVDNPTFVLYNRFRSVVRLFLFARKNSGELLSSAAVILEFSQAFDKETGLLSHIEPITKPLDQFVAGRTSNTPNSYSNPITGEWLFAEFPVAYDPCTCEESKNTENVLGSNLTAITIYGQYIKQVDIELEGITQAVTAPVVQSGSTNNNTGFVASIEGTVDQVTGALNKGATTQKSISNLTTKVGEVVGASDPKVKGDEGSKKGLPKWMTALPEVGRYFSALDFLITGGKENPKAKETPPATPIQSKFTGTLDLTGDIAGVQFYTPGSDQSGASSSIATPTYNYTLGIFNLLETPVLEHAFYQTAQNEERRDLNQKVSDPDLKQYHLKEPIKFAINPASELELVDLELAIIYRIGANNSGTPVFASFQENNHWQGSNTNRRWYGPAILKPTDPSLNYVERMAQNGIVVDSWPKDTITDTTGTEDIGRIIHSSGFVPASCIDNQSVLLSSWGNDAAGSSFPGLKTEPRFALKVKAVFKRTDQFANSSTEPVLFMASYDVEVEKTPVHTGSYGLPIFNFTTSCDAVTKTQCRYLENFHVNIPNPHFSLGTNGIPLTLKVNNVNITANTAFQAVHSIEIGPNVIVDPGVNVGFFAGREIDVDPGAVGVIFNDNVTLENRNFSPFNCTYTDPLPDPVSQPDIRNNFCHNKDKYDPNVVRKRGDREEDADKLSADDSFEVFPNPVNDQVTVVYVMEQSEEVEIWLSDITGKRVQTLLPSQVQDSGEQTGQFAVGSLSDGVYLINIQNGGQKHVRKLIIQKS